MRKYWIVAVLLALVVTGCDNSLANDEGAWTGKLVTNSDIAGTANSDIVGGGEGSDAPADSSADEELAEKSRELSELIDDLSYTTSVQELKKKYGTEKEQQIMPLYNVDESQPFTFHFKADMLDVDYFESVTVHTDIKGLPESKIYSLLDADVSIPGQTSITVKPYYALLSSLDTTRDEESWGYAPVYYLRVNYDLNTTTPTKLAKPLIIPFTVKAPIESPDLSYEITSDNRLKLVWDKVPGADRYKVYNVSSFDHNKKTLGPEEGYSGSFPALIGEVEGTEFTNFAEDNYDGQYTDDSESGRDGVISQNLLVTGDYYVTAVKGDKESNFSPVVSTHSLSKNLPMSLSDNAMFYSNYETVKELPRKTKVLFIDESEVTRNVIYGDYKLDESGFGIIDFKIEGTALHGAVLVFDFDLQAYEKLRSSSEGNQNNNFNGYIEPLNTTAHIPELDVPTFIGGSMFDFGDKEDVIAAQLSNTRKLVEKANEARVPILRTETQVPVNANSALEEYLALHLVNVSGVIPLDAFPEAQNFETLSDTFQQVMYQNPLIMDVENYGYDYNSLSFYVSYSDSRENIQQKQQETVAAAKRIVDTIIKPDMNNNVKRKVVYDYLNDNALYDDDALANAEAYNYLKVDKEYNDSFNAYGIMVDGIGVCSSYASAYKMLSDLAGLDSIVVTGKLGTGPHAWNKVLINKQWVNVDPTNNETNAGVPYMLYNTNDKTAVALDFHEDKDYWIDTELKKFASKDNSQDYYVSHGLEAATLAEYKSKLIKELKAGGSSIVIRLSADLDDDEIMNQTAAAYSAVAPDKQENAQMYELKNYIIIEH
ncbi:transglutaminase domain-containing protein [Paenibacillus donghaensis]|uniref:Transglutaminase-like domain-containing protein n=1 Tax=Paenibacillus donghaensis TaxID=414771 RepID=A0A2Z2KCR2_9BACL|nr:transglutaminase domain-containing protein [Paenibacillus donghaensis]ASA20790.1 hypothetical protein B9T62_08330 [Paenibacillus donghaensis]